MYLAFFNSDLKVITNWECDTHSHESCIQAHINTTVLPNGEYVNDAFTADDEVCGNDGRTYQSIHHLQCHTRHDKCEPRIVREMERERLDALNRLFQSATKRIGSITKYIITNQHLSKKFSHFYYARIIH